MKLQPTLALASVYLSTLSLCSAGRFRLNGPTVTVTLKEPVTAEEAALHPNSKPRKWLNLHNVNPTVLCSVQSEAKPFPEAFPRLESLQATVGYNHEEIRHRPSFVQGRAKFSAESHGVHLEIQPKHEFRTQRNTVMLQLSRGAAFVMARLGMRDLQSLSSSSLELVRGCYQVEAPHSSIRSVRFTPTWHVQNQEGTCVIEGTTVSERTKAVLNLEYDNPTLTIVHALDDRNVISPEINLYNGQIAYQWKHRLPSGSIRTKVDPASALHVTWTDQSRTGNWVTDVRLPLAGTTVSALAADIRVRKQFSF